MASQPPVPDPVEDSEDDELARALALSMQLTASSPAPSEPAESAESKQSSDPAELVPGAPLAAYSAYSPAFAEGAYSNYQSKRYVAVGGDVASHEYMQYAAGKPVPDAKEGQSEYVAYLAEPAATTTGASAGPALSARVAEWAQSALVQWASKHAATTTPAASSTSRMTLFDNEGFAIPEHALSKRTSMVRITPQTASSRPPRVVTAFTLPEMLAMMDECKTGSEPLHIKVKLFRDWNDEYQVICETPAHSPFQQQERQRDLSRIISEFVSFAEHTARVIVSELTTPDERKTVKPANLGGMAGGEKYKKGNVLFKFARDIHGLFGNNDSLAAKVACNEIRALNSVIGCNVHHLHTTLSSLFFINGHCIIATAWAPIKGRETLIYGSDDAGATVLDGNDTLRSLIEKIAAKLHLKAHVVFDDEEKPHTMAVAGDVEGHGSRDDGRYYLCDLARLFPPLPPRPAPWRQGDHLYRVFRPEFITDYPGALSDDAFSMWGRDGSRVHHAEIFAALKYMHEAVVPKLLADLEAQYGKASGPVAATAPASAAAPAKSTAAPTGAAQVTPEAFAALARALMTVAQVQGITPTATKPISALFHQHGVNIGFMAQIRARTAHLAVRGALLEEMVARCCKNILRTTLRLASLAPAAKEVPVAGQTPVPSKTPVPVSLLAKKLLRIVFCAGEPDKNEDSEPSRSQQFWLSVLPLSLADKFDLYIDAKEISALRSAAVATLSTKPVSSESHDGRRFVWRVCQELGIAETQSTEAQAVEFVRRVVQAASAEAGPALTLTVKRKVLHAPLLPVMQDAEQVLVEGLRMREELVGPDSSGLYSTLSALRNFYKLTLMEAGTHNREEIVKRGVKVCERAMHVLRDSSTLEDELARSADFYHICRMLPEAKKCYERCVEMRKRVYGPETDQTAKGIVCLANIIEEMGDVHGKKRLLEQALAITEKTRDTDTLASILNNLSIAHRTLGDLANASAMNLRSIELLSNIYGVEHPHTFQALRNYASLLNSMGKYQEEKQMLEQQLLPLAVKLFGTDSMEYAGVISAIGEVKNSTGDPRGQKKLFQEALHTTEARFGPEDVKMITPLRNLGDACSRLGEFKDAIAHMKRALAIANKHYGEQHLVTASVNYDLGDVYLHCRMIPQAVPVLEKALEVQERLGAGDVTVAKTVEALGMVYGFQSKLSLEKTMLEKAIAIKKKIQGPEHPNVILTETNLANCLGYLGYQERKRDILESAVTRLTKILGTSVHPSLASTQGNLGICYAYLGDRKKSMENLERALAIYTELFGEEHPNSQFIMERMELLIMTEGQGPLRECGWAGKSGKYWGGPVDS